MNPQATIGHIHLKVSNLERSITFYTQVLGFDLTTRIGDQAAFLSVGGYHHHIGLNTWESLGGEAPPQGSTGLYHFAILLPDRKALSTAIKRLNDHHWPIDGVADQHPNTPKEEWPKDAAGHLIMYTQPLDMEGLMKL